LRLIDSFITQLKIQGPSRTCSESKEEEEEPDSVNYWWLITYPNGSRSAARAMPFRARQFKPDQIQTELIQTWLFPAAGSSLNYFGRNLIRLGLRGCTEREFLIDNLLVRIHFIIAMIRWTGLAPWECEFPFPGSITSTFLN